MSCLFLYFELLQKCGIKYLRMYVMPIIMKLLSNGKMEIPNGENILQWWTPPQNIFL